MTLGNVVDLFCGVGGLTHGLRSAGLNIVADRPPATNTAYKLQNGPSGGSVQHFVVPWLCAVVNFIFHLTYELSEPLNSQILRTISMRNGVIQKVNRIV